MRASIKQLVPGDFIECRNVRTPLRDDPAESACNQIGRRKSDKKIFSSLPQRWKPVREVGLRPDVSAELSELTTRSNITPEFDQAFLNLHLDMVIMGLHSFLMTRTALLYGQASVAHSIGQFRIAKR
ncbi:hypothetical protein M514_13170 [Trichuris suis]|uniref:Uncharacterized protein n=1 Tax=Trichuris suis TaxID=68888 RepID=A0A085MUL0_9BILA|nr:hypothetical protein M513_13170 [Trichuris suis]KFD60906.1 hypothetical protein M514_13170 [Trichuris suis]